MIGLGRMGGNMAARLARGGDRVVGRTRVGRQVEGAEAASSLTDPVGRLSARRVLWKAVKGE